MRFWLDRYGNSVYIDTMTGRRFKELRKSMGYSQARLAREMGITIRTITRWERGEFPIPRIAELALRTVVREANKGTVSWEKNKKDLGLKRQPQKH